MKIRQLVIVLVMAAILGGGFLTMQMLAGMKEAPEKVVVPEAKKYVQTTKVVYENIETSIVAYGRVQATVPLDIIAEVGGKILPGQRPLQEGQRFRKGELLFKIDDSEAVLDLQAIKSNFLRDVAIMLADLKIDYPESFDKWQRYFNQINVTETLPELPVYATDKEKVFLATKDIFSSYYNIKSLESTLGKYRVYAPFNASITAVSLQAGSFVNPGTQIARLNQLSNLELKVSVEVADIKWVKIGQEVMISTEDNLQTWEGKVVRISDVVNPTTQSIDVFITIDTGKGGVFEGMYLKAIIPGGIIPNAMEVARSAIVNSNQLYTVVSDSLLNLQKIKVHKVNPETIIFSGLPANSDLVTEPLVNAYNNMKVAKLEKGQSGRSGSPLINRD